MDKNKFSFISENSSITNIKIFKFIYQKKITKL